MKPKTQPTKEQQQKIKAFDKVFLGI